MRNIDKINCKLKYEKYYDPNFNWDNSAFYYFDKNIFTYEFIDTFKDKINFAYLYLYNKIKLNIIEKYVVYYNENTWCILVSHYKNLFTPKFINKYHKFFKYPLPKDMYENVSSVLWNAKGYLKYLDEQPCKGRVFL